MFKATNLSKKHGWLVVYTATLVAVAVGFLLRLGLDALVGEGLPTYITFYPVIMVVALFGGVGPGLLATFMITLGADYWLLSPRGFGITSMVDAVGLVLFSGMGIFMSVVAELYRRSRLKAAGYEKEVALQEGRRQNEFLAGVVERSSQAFGTGYPDGRLGLVNRAFEQLTGYTAEELRAANWAETLTPPEWREIERQKLEELHRTGLPVRYEKEYLRKDGTRVPIELLVHLMRDSEGKPEYYYSFLTDITERKRAGEALRQSEERLIFALETSHTGAWDLNLIDHTAHRSLEHDRIFGYPSLLPRWTYEMFLEHVLPEDRSDADSKFRRAMETGGDWNFECRIRRADQQVRWIWAVGRHRTSASGVRERMMGIVQDITDRKQAEAAVHQLNATLQQRVAELQAANQDVETSRRAALSLAEDALEAHRETERVNANLKASNESLGVARRAAVNIMEDALRARRLTEQASVELHKAAEQRRLALESADLGSWDYQFQAGVVFWDERCREMWGIPQADHIDYTGAIAAIHPEDRAGVDEAVKQALAGIAGGAYHREFRVVWPDGSVRWIASHGRAYFQGEGGERLAVRFIGANQDITERRQREEQLQKLNRALTAHSKSDQALVRAKGEAEFLEAVCRIVVEDCGHAMVWIGYAEEDEARTVRPAAQAGFEEGYLETLNLTWADTERGRGPTGTAIRTGQPGMCRNMQTDPAFAPWRAEAIKRGYASSLVLPLLADGRGFGALSIYSRQPDGFGEAEVKLLTDLASDLAYGITVLRLRVAKELAEAALRQSAEELQRSNRDLEQFAYVASHDLQEPLRAVGGYVKLLQHRFPDKLDPKARDYIAGAFEGATRMERLITDLLSFSRVGTSGGTFVPADLNVVLDQALRNLRTGIESSHAAVTHDPLPTLAVDATQIMQLFQNLIGNALKFHGEQPPRIHVGAQRQEGRWVFAVRDNGIGIEPQYYERIFQIFQRLHTRKAYPGTGIGLAICKKIAERHGGTIWIESQPGQGSTFYFSIPEAAAKPSQS